MNKATSAVRSFQYNRLDDPSLAKFRDLSRTSQNLEVLSKILMVLLALGLFIVAAGPATTASVLGALKIVDPLVAGMIIGFLGTVIIGVPAAIGGGFLVFGAIALDFESIKHGYTPAIFTEKSEEKSACHLYNATLKDLEEKSLNLCTVARLGLLDEEEFQDIQARVKKYSETKRSTKGLSNQINQNENEYKLGVRPQSFIERQEELKRQKDEGEASLKRMEAEWTIKRTSLNAFKAQELKQNT